jgi:hypothetical protein
MSQLEDEIRASLRSEAERLREVRPLHLPRPAAERARRPPGAGRAWWTQPWLAPAAAAAVVVAIAALLVSVKVLTGGAPSGPGVLPATAPAPSTPQPVPGYYVRFGQVQAAGGTYQPAIIAGNAQTGKTLGSYRLPGGPGGGAFTWAAAGAADDRTFVVQATTDDPGPPSLKWHPQWYLVRLYPGTREPVRVTRLNIEATAATADSDLITSIALSPDGTELAVVTDAGNKGVGLGAYSVATGRLQHSWSVARTFANEPDIPVTDPSWVGDHTVAFTYTVTADVRQEVRELDLGAAGTGLLSDSLAVWSQYVPAPAGGTYGKATPRTCATPFLSGDGQTVVCGSSSYSARDKRLTALWLAYPLATPTRPRVLGRVEQAANVSKFDTPTLVQWVNFDGTTVIGAWNPEVVTYPNGSLSSSVTNRNAVVGGGRVTSFPAVPYLLTAW